MSQKLSFEIERQVISEGYDRKTEWFCPHVDLIPPNTAIVTATLSHLHAGDIFSGCYVLRSEDGGHTWSEPVKQSNMQRRITESGIEICPCDWTPKWHQATRKLLMTGHTAAYGGSTEQGAILCGSEYRRYPVWSVFDQQRGAFGPWHQLELPDAERFFWACAGAAQRVDLPNGEILLPVYFKGRESITQDFWNECFSSTVLRCTFDGERMSYREHGSELTVPDPRGLVEPSLTHFANRYYLTLRNDVRAYVAVSDDGLNFDEPRPWMFDDGQELGSYNTQQHWVTHSDGLFLCYTRHGANNEHVFRCRAPLFMAQVETKTLKVIRDSEVELVPNYGAGLGNFGAIDLGPKESWVITSECMAGDAHEPFNLELTEQRGANNRIWLCRIKWNNPSTLVNRSHR